MYVKNSCYIEVTKPNGTRISFDALESLSVDKSIDRVGSACTIRIPASAAMVYKDGSKTESAQTAKQFDRGDRISVWLGYNGRMSLEFEGFIYRVNYTTPVEIECEGFEYLLRNDLPTKTFANTTLKDVLNYTIASAGAQYGGIVLTGDIPHVEMVDYVIPANLNGIAALQQIKEHYGLTVYLDGFWAYAGLDFVRMSGEVKYSLGVNTPRADELKYQREEDVKLKVKAIQINKDNTKLEAEVGDPKGEQRTLYFYTAKSTEDLKRLAETELKKYKYSGYTGKLTTLLEPPAHPGMVAVIDDPKYDRGGKYEIRSVVTTFGTGGAQRSVEIGKTVSDG